MAHQEKDLDSSIPCSGERGTYLAAAYVMIGKHAKRRFVDLGYYSETIETTVAVVQEMQARLGCMLNLGDELPLVDFAAASVMRQCQRKRHTDTLLTDDKTHLERVASYVFARAATKPDEILLPELKNLRQISAHGFGHARHTDPAMAGIDTLIYLPTTPLENRDYVMNTAIKAYPQTIGLSDQPYVALHVHPETAGCLEKIVTPDELA